MNFGRKTISILAALIMFMTALLPVAYAENNDALTAETVSTAEIEINTALQSEGWHTVSFIYNGRTTTRTVYTGDKIDEAYIPKLSDNTMRFVGWENENGVLTSPQNVEVVEDCTYTAFYAPFLKTVDHDAYMHGYGGGLFAPGNNLTRAQISQLIYNLFEDEYPAEGSFLDVGSDAWYAEAMCTLGGLGILKADENGNIYPNEYVTRAEIVDILCRFYPAQSGENTFSDVPEDYWAENSIITAVEYGWIIGNGDGTFNPEGLLTRAQTVTMVNRILGRHADKETIDSSGITGFFDVEKSAWYYYDIMEACVGHQYTTDGDGETWTEFESIDLGLDEGLFSCGFDLYYIGSDGNPVKNQTVNGRSFGDDGKYTSGNAQLDSYVMTALSQITTPDASLNDKRYAAYIYMRDDFDYLRRNYYDVGETGWEEENALVMFETHLGNCYSYAAAFCYLTRQLGDEATAISGLVGSNRNPHGWVEIVQNGVTYICDPEIEMARAKRGITCNLYMMERGTEPWDYLK